MALRHRETQLVLQGKTIDEISRQLGQPLHKVIQDLRLQAGEGDIKLSEIFFAIPENKREALEQLIRQNGTSSPEALQKQAAAQGFDWWELDLYCRLREPKVFRGDLYEYLSDTEVALHRLVRATLVKQFGLEEAQWWRKGVPVEIRKDCAQVREEDPEPVDDLFAYTTFIHLAKIMDRHWALFGPYLPRKFAEDKKKLLQEFTRLNTLRNAVMHPVKGRTWGANEFAIVREWHRYFVRP